MARWLFMGMVVWLAGGCSVGPEPIRSSGRSLQPSRVQAGSLDVTRLAKTDDCASCHADVAAHWTNSVHANASFDNPWYRASVDEFRDERGKAESRFCAGCHDPLLLLSGDIDQEVEPENPLAYAGITCLVCHGVESTRPDGNASFTLTDADALIPDPADPEAIDAHRARLGLDPLRTSSLCGSCHRSFSGPEVGNPNHLPGIDDLGDWASSAFAGAVPDHLVSVEQQRCQDCHMPLQPASGDEMAGATDGTIRGHRWAASHSAMAAQLPDPSYAREVDETLRGAVLLDVGPVRAGKRRYVMPEESRIRGGERLVFDVLIDNQATGHRFPGGVRDMHDAWLEVEVRDARGKLLAVSRPDGADRSGVFVLKSTVLDAEAVPETLHRVHRFATPAFDRTIRPHDARAVRYATGLPSKVALPLSIDARLLHRKHSLGFQAAACEASLGERGKRFAAGAEAHGKVALDPCLEQPVTEIAAASTWVGRGAEGRTRRGGAARPEVERLLTQGLALLHGKQEHVHLAKPSIDRALERASETGSNTTAARAWALRARLASMQGRPDEAATFLARAEALVGPSPVLDRIRGDANSRVWRWKEAAEAYRRVVDAAPTDFTAWRSLARAYGSLSDDDHALRAADAGLRLAPRDEGLLRSRALALEGLGHPDADQARDRWLAHRTPDAAPGRLAQCEQNHERCLRDRQPIPHYTLSPPQKAIHASVDPG